MRVRTKFSLIALYVLAGAGCGSHHGTSSPPPPPPAPDAAVAPDPVTSLVTSAVMIDACPDSKKLDTRAANREIDELVGPCKSVPGGAAHFAATLKPGGAVELGAPSGTNPDDGVVPTCLIQKQSQLRHKLKLASPCKFDVKLEQRPEAK